MFRRCARQIVVIEDVQLTRETAAPLYGGAQACTEHDYDVMRPVVLASWKHEFQGEPPDFASMEEARAWGCLHREILAKYVVFEMDISQTLTAS